MNISQKDAKNALKIIKKYQGQITHARSDEFHNQKRLAIYWMCTAICERTNCLMNDGLSRLFNQLHRKGWIKFSCQPSSYLRYHFYFTKGSQISLTPAGEKIIQDPSAHHKTIHSVVA